jgi:murein tripeptide amidase MpaA
LNVPVLTVSSKDNSQKDECRNKYIVVIARSHPGESSGSWVIDGLIDWIKGQSDEVEDLIKKVTLKVIPMMNPDGVFMGNYRTGITGLDFNRNFDSGKPSLFPESQALKRLILHLQKNGEVIAFLDLHGHSILRNSFIFGPNQSSFNAS